MPAGLEDIAQLGRTLWRRRGDVLAYFDHHSSNGPTEASSTAAWKPCAATPSDSATSPITGSAHCCTLGSESTSIPMKLLGDEFKAALRYCSGH